jgi:hypothetical protein
MLLDDDRYRSDAEQQEQALPRDGQFFASYPGHFARLFPLLAEKYIRLCMQVEKSMINTCRIAFLWAPDQNARMVNVQGTCSP